MTDFLLNEKLISSMGSINKCWLFFLRVCPGPIGGMRGTQNWNGWFAPTAASSYLQFNLIKDGAGCWAAFESVAELRSSRRKMEAGYKQEKNQHYSSPFQSECSGLWSEERASTLWLNYQQNRKNKQALDAWHQYRLAGIHVTQSGGSSSLQSENIYSGYGKQLFSLVSTPLFFHLQSTHSFPRHSQKQSQWVIAREIVGFIMRCKRQQRLAETQKCIWRGLGDHCDLPRYGFRQHCLTAEWLAWITTLWWWEQTEEDLKSWWRKHPDLTTKRYTIISKQAPFLKV